MIKINKRLSYILATLVIIMLVIVSKNSMTSEGKNQNDRVKENFANVFLNDKSLEFSKGPILEENQVYVPIDELGEKIGAEVKIKKSKKVIIKKGDKNLVINTNDNTAITEKNETFFINNISKKNKIYLPIDTILKHFGFEVSGLSENAIKIYGDSKDVQKLEGGDIKDKEKELKKPENTDDLQMQPPTEEQKEPIEKIAYLTFDDGPNVNTSQILDVLKEKNVKATFFMLGSSILAHEDITKRISDEGHGVGVHSMTHNFKSVYASPESFLHEMTITNDALERITGDKTLLLRAPYGSKPYMKEEYRDLLTSWGYRIWDWNVDSKDSIKKHTTPDEVYNEVVNQVVNKDEAVILFHDKEHTLQALPKIKRCIFFI